MRNQWAKLGGVLGIAYCIAGFGVLFLGWNGAASSDRVEEQLPYVISGGMAGLALVVIGAALIVTDSLRNDRVEMKDALDELRRTIAATGSAAPSSGAATGAATVSSGGGVGAEVVAGAQSYHLPTCSIVAGQPTATRMAVGDAIALGLEPCRVCGPDRLVS